MSLSSNHILGYSNPKATCNALNTLGLKDEQDAIRSRIREFRESERDSWDASLAASQTRVAAVPRSIRIATGVRVNQDPVSLEVVPTAVRSTMDAVGWNLLRAP